LQDVFQEHASSQGGTQSRPFSAETTSWEAAGNNPWPGRFADTAQQPVGRERQIEESTFDGISGRLRTAAGRVRRRTGALRRLRVMSMLSGVVSVEAAENLT
jgi:hypothetical protein